MASSARTMTPRRKPDKACAPPWGVIEPSQTCHVQQPRRKCPHTSWNPRAASTWSTRPTCSSSARARAAWRRRWPARACGVATTLVERFGCLGGNMTAVGVEGFAWYRHEQTVEAGGIGLRVRDAREGDGGGGARKPIAFLRARLRRLQAGRRSAGRGSRRPPDAAPAVRRADSRRRRHRRRRRGIQGRPRGDPRAARGRRDRRRRRRPPRGRADAQDAARGHAGGFGDVPPRRRRQGGVPRGRPPRSADL